MGEILRGGWVISKFSEADLSSRCMGKFNNVGEKKDQNKFTALNSSENSMPSTHLAHSWLSNSRL